MPRVPNRRRWKTYFRVLFPSLAVLIATFLTVVGYLSYQIIFPKVLAEGNPVHYSLFQYQEVPAPYSGGSAWFLPGDAGSPAVFLCHDYGFNRLSALNLAHSLHEQRYNVFVVSLRGHSSESSVPTSLGLLEGFDLAAMIDWALAAHGVDQTRVAVWGVGLGAHAALRAALIDPRIKLLVLDSPYSSVYDFLDYLVTKQIGFKSKIFGGAVGIVSAAFSLATPVAIFEKLTPASLEDRVVLYVAGEDSPAFVEWTRKLHEETPGQKDLLLLPRSRRSVLATGEWSAYDKQVTQFITHHLPISADRLPSSTSKAGAGGSRRVAARQR
ncbi:MAG TPA: hypothetical protein PLP42_14635 [Acidobacteriota bacterium]|jgi:hypothetical protein|nr:hypothetical protein [Acidobacteriota bacterium]